MSPHKKTDHNVTELYNTWYKENAYKSHFTFLPYEEAITIIQSTHWEGREVLEIGCGEGGLASILNFHGASVTAIDTSDVAIQIANKRYHLENLAFHCMQPEEVTGKYDVVVMQGVLEHIDDPFAMLKYLRDKLLTDTRSEIISSSPSFLNPRGYIWMTLQLLFGIPMSLSDVHFLCPFDYEKFAEKLGMSLSYKSCDQEWGNGQKLIIDYRKRLVNALKDAGMEGNVDDLLSWLGKAVEYQNNTEYSGATVVYKFDFSSDR